MEMNATEDNKLMPIGEFAKLTGVSQRALRFYEQKQLLSPSYVSDTGRRYYRLDDLIPLQQILTFKYLGFSLEDIRSMMSLQTRGLKHTLAMQKQAMKHKRYQIDQIIKALDHALELLDEDASIDSQVFTFLIQSMITQQEQIDYLSEIFPEQTIDHLKQFFADEERELIWNKRSAILIQNIKEAIRKYPPESEEVQSLIEELIHLALEMLGDSFESLYSAAERLESVDLPGFFGSPFSSDEETLLMKACDIYINERMSHP